MTDRNFAVQGSSRFRAERQHDVASAVVRIKRLGKCGRRDDRQRSQGGQKLLHVASSVIEISREETAKRAGLFLPVGGQRLISDNVFLNKE